MNPTAATPTVAIVAPGNMGAAMGKRLTGHGVTVLTALAGRGPASVARAQAAGMRDVTDAGIAGADIVLSVVPPGEAVATAHRFAPHLANAAVKPVYVDCNAVHPGTAAHIGAIIAETGARFVDGGIIGMPPEPGSRTILYVSGPDAPELVVLNTLGLQIEVLDGPPEAASALKMSYAGITKGFTALGSAMMLAATRAGTAPALARELAASQPALLGVLSRSVPNMYAKAYRWVAEMEEIAAFVGQDPAAAQFYLGAARLFERLAADHAGAQRETGALDAFIAQAKPKTPSS